MSLWLDIGQWPDIIRIQKKYKNHMSLIEKYKLKKEVKPKKLSKEEELEIKFEKEATKELVEVRFTLRKERLIGILKINFESNF